MSYPVDANKYQRDLLFIKHAIKQNHPGVANNPLPFFQDERDFENLFQKTYKELADINSDQKFYFIIKKLITDLGDGHMNLVGDIANTTLLPLFFIIIKNKLFVITVSDNSYYDLLLKEIVSVNNIKSIDIINYAYSFTSSDKNNLYAKNNVLHGATQLMLNPFFWKNIIEKLSEIKSSNESIMPEFIILTYKDSVQKNSKELTKKVYFKPKEDVKFKIENILLRNNITFPRKKYAYNILPEKNLLYIQLNTLPQTVDHDFYNRAFKEAKAKKCESLVLDLRNNGGGNSNWCNEFLPYIIDTKSEVNIYKGWSRHGKINKSISGKYWVTPKGENIQFTGKVYVLTSSMTLSSATFFVVAIKDNNLGYIIGEPCGQNNIRYGYTSEHILPHTKMIFRSSIRIWERAVENEAEKYKPITPDYYIQLKIEDYFTHTDPVWEYIMNKINKKIP